jgi:putative transposase
MGLRGRSNLSDEEIFFVTTTVVNHACVFSERKYCALLVQQIKTWQEHFRFDVLGYVIMPSHFHWIVKLEPTLGTISDVMRELKSHAAWTILDELERDRRRDLCALFAEASYGLADQRRKFWTKRFDDEVIRNREMFRAKLLYIHNNPVKAGLVGRAEDYEFSSARNYICGDHSILYVNTSYAG